jgi:hypothetical protein
VVAAVTATNLPSKTYVCEWLGAEAGIKTAVSAVDNEASWVEPNRMTGVRAV